MEQEKILVVLPVKEEHKVRYPGQGTLLRRQENMKNGIPVSEEIWKEIMSFLD